MQGGSEEGPEPSVSSMVPDQGVCPWGGRQDGAHSQRQSVRPHWGCCPVPPSESWKCLEVWAGLWSGGGVGLGGVSPQGPPPEALRTVPPLAAPPPVPRLPKASRC